MARINTRPFHAPSSSVNDSSDQENLDPGAARREKGKGRVMDVSQHQRSSLPTPTSEGSEDVRGQKRKRAHPDPQHNVAYDEQDEDAEDKVRFNKYFNPNQDPEERRDVKRKSRALERDFQDRRDELLRDSGDGLRTTIKTANEIFQHVKQTGDATTDSRLLVNVSDLANKKTAQLVLGDSSTGVDVDEFLSKCITFMRNGGPLQRDDENAAAPQRHARRRRTRDRNDSDDEEDMDDIIGEALDWEVLGRVACFPSNARPCVPSFLLGPLSVEKKHRTQTQRRARQSKDTSREARPENVSTENLTQSDANSLRTICINLRSQLMRHQAAGEKALQENGITPESISTKRGKDLLRRHRLADNGCVGLFDFVLNPHSFGQTIENLFYMSFLIKEGSVGIVRDSKEMPTLMPSEPSTLEDQRKNKSSKHQAVLALDYSVWRQLVEALDIREPLIQHRPESQTQNVGANGWYS